MTSRVLQPCPPTGTRTGVMPTCARSPRRESTPSRPATCRCRELPAPTAGFERWIFVDGHFTAEHPDRRGSAATLLDSRAAGADAGGHARCRPRRRRRGLRACAQSMRRAATEVLQVARPTRRAANVEVLFVAAPGAAQRHFLSTRAGARRPQRAAEPRRTAPERRQRAIPSSMPPVDVALDAGATLDHIRDPELRGRARACSTRWSAHVGENAANYRLRTVTLGGLAARSTAFIKLAGRAARCEYTAAQHRERPADRSTHSPRSIMPRPTPRRAKCSAASPPSAASSRSTAK